MIKLSTLKNPRGSLNHNNTQVSRRLLDTRPIHKNSTPKVSSEKLECIIKMENAMKSLKCLEEYMSQKIYMTLMGKIQNLWKDIK